MFMSKLYLLGGENIARRSAKEINTQAFKEAYSTPNVLVIPWASPSFDDTYRKRTLVTDYFRSLGADSVEFAEYTQAVKIADKINAANVIYLTGGQTSILIERAKTMNLTQILKTYNGIIVGRSAGALALCNRCITTCRYNGIARIINGLGLINLTLKAHYISKNDETLKFFSLKEKIYAVPKDSALIYEHGKIWANGNVYVFNGGRRSRFIETTL
jgi:peptidase E